MNESDTDANTKAIDSLLNFETVKYFGAEAREAAALRQGDGALRAHERADLRLAGGAQRRPGRHLHARTDRRPAHVRGRDQERAKDRRRLRAHQPDDAAALPAAQLHGHGLPRHQAGDRRHRGDVRDPRPESGDRGRSRRAAAPRDGGRRAIRVASNSPTTRRGRSCAGSRSRPSPARRSRSSGRRAPASRRSPGSCSASTSRPPGAS